MQKILKSNFICITKADISAKLNIVDIFKREFNSCIEDKSLDCNIIYSIDNLVAKFEFIKKEK